MMKSLSVSDYTHKLVMDLKDSDHKSQNAVILGIINKNKTLEQSVSSLMEQISSDHLVVSEFTEDEQKLIFEMLDGPLKSEDQEIQELAESIDNKLK